MKTLNASIFYVLLCGICMMTACQQDELDSFNFQPDYPGSGPVYKAPNPGGIPIRQPKIIKEKFRNARGWRIIWEVPGRNWYTRHT